MTADHRELISTDTNQLITTLLVYRIAAKILSPQEINNIIDGGADTIIEQFSIHTDKNIVEKVTKDTAENMKNLIQSMHTN